MSGTIVLLVGALILRASGAAVRVGGNRLPVHAVGWVLSAASAWMVAGAAGAWFPLWPALALGAIGGIVDSRLNRRELWIGADIVIVILSGLFSIPPVRFSRLAGAAVGAAGAGFVLDSLLIRSSKRVRTAICLLLPVACLAIGMIRPFAVIEGARFARNMLRQNMWLHIGLTPAHAGERVVLDTGSVAWLERPLGKGPFAGVLFFHGAHPDGSRQPSAIVLRRALLGAGFVVLSLDHPGFGESPAPSLDADVGAWDPLPTALAALRTLGAVPAVGGIALAGHSMGSTDVLRLLSVKPRLRSAVVFGAALRDPSERVEYWNERFHTDRRMHQRASQGRVFEIRRRFYNNGRIVKTLPEDHAPILFVRFGLEWSDIVATRNALYDAIPGSKMAWDLATSTHYFSSHGGAGLVVGDTRVTRALTSRLRLLTLGKLSG